MGIVKERCYLLFPFFRYMILFLSLPLLPLSVHSQCTRNPIIFNFGDSNSDTGGYVDGLGLSFVPPNGRTYFHQPAGRLADGRLMIDFLCYKDLVGDADFENALYTIDIGQNDLANSFESLNYSQVVEKIPSFITEIKYAIWNIYQKGGKNFWVHNTGPLGCLPQKLAYFARNASQLDEHGCLLLLNDAAKAFNAQLRVLCEQLNSQLMNATIVYVDIYSIKYDLITNASNYGFEHPLMACCGNGGPPYNYDANITCGRTGYTVCHEGSKFISWDGVHYTEAANAVFASKILSSNYTTPRVNFNFFCTKM